MHLVTRPRNIVHLGSLAVLLALISSSCGGGVSRDDVIEPDFIGVLQEVVGDDWQRSGLGGNGRGGPSSGRFFGPGTLVLADGAEVVIPPNTPGGSFCLEIPGGVTPSRNQNARCLIVGELDGEGAAAWFATLPALPSNREGEYLVGSVNDVHDDRIIVQIAGTVHVPLTLGNDPQLIDCEASSSLEPGSIQLPGITHNTVYVDTSGKVTSVFCAEEG